MVPPPSTPIAPTTPHERIDVIDMVRGFAIFGILLVNMHLFASPVYGYTMGLDLPDTPWDQAAAIAIRFLAESKFYSLFSMLFGLGLTIQMTRAQARGRRFVPLYLRRLLVLLGIGLIHAYVFWSGDILVTYAIVGMLLILFRNARPRTLLIWAGVFIMAPLLVMTAGWGLMAAARMTPEGAAMIDEALAEQQLVLEEANAHSIALYQEGSWPEQLIERINENTYMYSVIPFMATSVLAMFLVGMAVGKAGILQDIPAHSDLIRGVQRWGLVIGLTGNLIGTVLRTLYPVRIYLTPWSILGDAALVIGAPALSLFYATTIIRLAQTPQWKQRLMPVAAVGRMALSNYLLQTLICTTIFYNYGLGLYGRVGHAVGLLLTIAIYALQIPLSVWWLRHFEFGPIEWLWRSLTYGAFQPMRLHVPKPPVARVA